MNVTVRDVMRQGVLTCPADLRLGDVTKRLLEQGVHALFVEDSDSSIVGLISDMDLLAGEWLYTDDESLEVMRGLTASELMSAPVKSVDVGESLGSTAARMGQEHVHRLLVVDGDKPVGVISISDVVAALGTRGIEGRTVREVMSRAIVVCRTDTPLHAVSRGMSERHSRSVVVVESSGAPKGIVTGMDLMQFASDEAGMDRKTAADVMHAPATIGPDASLTEAADRMITDEIHRLLVVDPDHPHDMPLGLISTSDILVEMAQPGSVWQPRDNAGR